MEFAKEASERWQTLKSTGGRLLSLALAALTLLGLYDVVISQILPENYKSSLPKFYEAAQMMASALSTAQWFYGITLLILIALFEEVHRRRFGKEGVTNIFLLFITATIVLFLAQQQASISTKKSGEFVVAPKSTPDSPTIEQYISQNNKIIEIESKLSNLSKSFGDLDKNVKDYFGYLSQKAYLAKIGVILTNFDAEAATVKNSYCADLKLERGQLQSNYSIRNMNIFPPMMREPMLAARQEVNDPDPVPDTLTSLRDKFRTANRAAAPDGGSDDLIVSRINYRQACDMLDSNMEKIKNKLQAIQSSTQSRISAFEAANKI